MSKACVPTTARRIPISRFGRRERSQRAEMVGFITRHRCTPYRAIGVNRRSQVFGCSKHQEGGPWTTMAGIDLSLEASGVCIVYASGKILREAKVLSQPDNLIGWFRDLGLEVMRIGLEAGPLSHHSEG
jgi:hypothetical protein